MFLYFNFSPMITSRTKKPKDFFQIMAQRRRRYIPLAIMISLSGAFLTIGMMHEGPTFLSNINLRPLMANVMTGVK